MRYKGCMQAMHASEDITLSFRLKTDMALALQRASNFQGPRRGKISTESSIEPSTGLD
jgi:hypothetical protein